MKSLLSFAIVLTLMVATALGQNTLDKLSLTSASPAQVAYGLRQLSTSYMGPAVKVRRSIDDAEANVAFDASTALSGTSIATLTPGVTVNVSLGTSGSGTISTVAAKSGTITIVVNKTGTITAPVSSNVVTGVGTNFTSELAPGDVLYKSDNSLIGVVKTINSNTSLILNNNVVAVASAANFKSQKAVVAGSGTSFTTEFNVGDRIFNTSHVYLGTISSITDATHMSLNARDAVAVTGNAFEGTSNIVTGSGTSFTGSDVDKMLISNNVTLGIIFSVESTTSVTLTTKAGAAVSGTAFKSTDGSMPFSTFYAGATTIVTVTTWYDQSGNGRDATQPVAASQPQIVYNGALNLINGKPAISFPSSDYLQTSAAASWLTNTLYTQNVVTAEGSPVSAYQIPISTTGSNGPNNTVMHYGYRSPSQYTVAQYGNDLNFEVFATTALELHTSVKNAINSSQMYHNGALLGTMVSGQSSHMNDLGLLQIGYYFPTGSYYKGSISEITVYATALSEVGLLNTNQLGYYGVSTATWTGSTDTDWTKTTNWSNGIVPTSTSPSLVVIPDVTNQPIISGTSAATSITVLSGATFTVSSGGTLQLYGTLSGKGKNCDINGTIEFMSTGQTILNDTYTSDAVYNLKLNRSGGSTVSMVGNLIVENDLNIGAASKLFIQNVTLTLNGTITGDGVAGGLRGSTNASLIVTGTAAPTLSFEQTGTYHNLKSLTISTSGIVSLATGCNLFINNNGNLSFSSNGKLALGANTLTIRGGVINTTSGGLIGGASSNLTMEGTTNRTLSFDQTTPGTTNLLNNFSVSTTTANTLTAGNDFSVNGTLTIASGQTLIMGTNALGGTLTSVASSGTINTQNTSATPIPSGKTWGGTVNYNNTSTAQTAMAGTYTNLTIGTTGGATASGDITVNGVLSLAANPNETNGTLEMTNSYGDYSNHLTPDELLTFPLVDPYTETQWTGTWDILDSDILTMGPLATYTGSGDVTGRVKRTSIEANTEYSFGSSYSTITFSSGGTLPSAVMFVITKGSDRGIHANATAHGKNTVQRLYQIIQTGGSGNTFTLKLKYLETELNSNTESNLVLWDHHIPYSSTNTPHEHGKTAQNSSENWVSLSGHAISYLATNETIGGFSKYWMINTSASTDGNTWQGAGAGDLGYQWDFASNWSAGNVPTAASKVIIPITAKYPTLAATSAAASITILEGASLSGGTNTTLTISGGPASNGGVGSWNNAGTFNPGTSTVIFDYTDATISGETNFNNVTISSLKALTPQDGAIVRIGGTITNNGTWNTYLFDNTVEYNGAVQTVVKPASATPAYRNLILSGSGSKTLPTEALSVLGDFSMSGTASAAPLNALTIGGHFTLGSGTTFTAGSLSHSIGGNFENNGGTFIPGSSTFNFNGTTAQTIGGSTTPAAFNNVTVSNTSGVTLLNNTTASDLNIASGALTVTAGKSLDATGTTTLNSEQCLVLKSNATETASFKDNGTITSTNGGTARIERYLTPYTEVSDLKFHFLSSPVGDAQLIENEFVDLSSSDITDFFKWNESGNEWTNYRGASYVVRNEDFGDSFRFVAGTGYLVAYPAAVTKNFVGTPNTSIAGISIPCTNTATTGHGWNLIGNPFPSSIDWTNVGITKTGMDAALYYYDNSTPGYKYYTYFSGGLGGATQYIAPMQGFMVHASAASGSVSIANGARTHSGQDVFYKNVQLTTNILDLKVDGNNKTDYARVCFYDQATENFDGDFDAFKLFSYSATASELYSMAPDNTSLAINTLPTAIMEGGTVPISFKAGTSGSFALTAEKISSFSANTYITLEDKLTQSLQKLNDNPVYEFQASPQDAVDRFVLHFKDATSVPEITDKETLNISLVNGNINIITGLRANAMIMVSNMLGQVVLRSETHGNQHTVLNAGSLPNGVYVVSIVANKKVESVRVVINR